MMQAPPLSTDYLAEKDTINRTILERSLGFAFSEGNQIDVLRNGEEIFPAMLDAIDAAEHDIDFLTFVYWTGDIAQRFAHELAEKAKAGIKVRVLLDSYGAGKMSDELLDMMSSAGAEVRWFRPMVRWKVWQTNNRTHRKILVVDGNIGFTGGVGIASEWEGDARNPSEWRDTHFRIRGPAVDALQGAFIGNWIEAGGDLHPYLAPVARTNGHGSMPVQVVRATASIGRSDIATLLEAIIGLAERHIQISSAYFVPDECMIARLKAAVQRGVRVDIMFPGTYTDQRVSQLAGANEFAVLLEAGIRLWRYEKTMLHTKILTVDETFACIGSANFNQRSMRQDDEIALVVWDAGLTGILNEHFEQDLQFCEPFDPANWRDRGLGQRLLETLVQPFKSHL